MNTDETAQTAHMDPGRTVSGEPNVHSGSFNSAEQFSIDVSFDMFYSTAKSRLN